MWNAPSLQWVKRGAGHGGTNHAAGRVGGDSDKGRPLRSGHTQLPGEAGPSPGVPPLSPGVCLPSPLTAPSLHQAGGWVSGNVGEVRSGSLRFPRLPASCGLYSGCAEDRPSCGQETSLRFWDRILGFKISSVMLLGNQPRSWSCRRSPKIQPGRRRQEGHQALQVAWAGPPSVCGSRAEGELDPGQPSQGAPCLLTPTDGNAPDQVYPPEAEGEGAASREPRCPCTRRGGEPAGPCAIAGPMHIDSGTHSQALNNLRLPHLWPEGPQGPPSKRKHPRGWWDDSWPRMPRHPLLGQPFPEPQAPESWVVS